MLLLPQPNPQTPQIQLLLPSQIRGVVVLVDLLSSLIQDAHLLFPVVLVLAELVPGVLAP